MKNWKAYVQFNGEDESVFSEIDFEISDEMYNKIKDAIANNIPLCNTDFYGELCDLADESVDIQDIVEYLEDEPYEEDYEDDDEYQAAMEEYEEYRDEFYEGYSLEEIIIEDPGDEVRFAKRFVGRCFPDHSGAGVEDFDFEYAEEKIVRYNVGLEFDETGMITRVPYVNAEGLQSESVRSSSFGTAAPDYEWLADQLEEILV